MAKRLALCLALLSFVAQSPAQIKIEVKNSIKLERVNETVEIRWSDIVKRDKKKAVTPENIIVSSLDGKQLPSQVIFERREGSKYPEWFIFQATVESSGKSDYIISAGEREDYPAQVYGRFVPERKDDYAWENNMVAFRAYGPALESETSTPGIDIWSKRTSGFIINKWYAGDNYHTDHGEGLDGYKVGNTLGGGASAPLIRNQLFPSGNFVTWETLDNGPVRTTVRLTYAPFDINSAFDSDRISALVKTISLDANSRFNRVLEEYSFSAPGRDIAVGMALHGDTTKYYIDPGYGFIAVMEAASDSRTGSDGEIASAVIAGGYGADGTDGNIYLIMEARRGIPVIYYFGAGWSKYGVRDIDDWIRITRETKDKINTPLKVNFKMGRR